MTLTDHSRQNAGTAAYAVAQAFYAKHGDKGLEYAADYLEGALAAFALALVAIGGSERAREAFNSAMAGFIPARSRPKLITDDGERVA